MSRAPCRHVVLGCAGKTVPCDVSRFRVVENRGSGQNWVILSAGQRSLKRFARTGTVNRDIADLLELKAAKVIA